jgi:hypothetical protein
VSAVLPAVVEVYRVGSVKVRSWWSTVSITVPQLFESVFCMLEETSALAYSASVVGSVQMEIISRLSQTVQVRRLGQARPEAEVLRLKDKACCRSIEESLICILSSDGEGERIISVRKDQSRICRIKAVVALRSGPDRLLDLKDLLSGIVDLDVQPLLYRLSAEP